ncbi:MAG: DUF192 domain-containing protein [Bacteroidales bacterium]|nr:DUF192 domain-containing protein [Bacteroidales bacterium]
MANIRDKDQKRTGIYTDLRKSKGKPIVYIAMLLLIIISMVITFNPKWRAKKMSRDQQQSVSAANTDPEFTKQGELIFYKSDNTQNIKIDIEVADTEPLRNRGLMYRRQMELGHGMLFIFPDEDYRSFWMKNTYLPLDIIYLDARKKIIRIHENVATLNEQPIPSDAPAQYVVEVIAGFCAIYNIRVGDVISFARI